MNKSLIITIFLVILVLVMINVFHTGEPENLNLLKLKQEYVQPDVVSVDHSTFPELQKTFNSPQDVTETCISCHTERHTEIMESAHWNWERVAYVEGRGITKLGKKKCAE
jgi:hypothetical protein